MVREKAMGDMRTYLSWDWDLLDDRLIVNKQDIFWF